jgi:hypothetical protein
MLLGDIISSLQDETGAMEALVGLDDLTLLARVQSAAADEELSLGEFVAHAVGMFTDQASDEDWVSLIGALGQAEDPGRTCLRRMVEFALQPQPTPGGCSHGHA